MFKGPLRTAVLFYYSHFQNDGNKEYFLISQEEIDNKRELIKGWFKIKGCIAMYMISFFPMVRSKQRDIFVPVNNVLLETS